MTDQKRQTIVHVDIYSGNQHLVIRSTDPNCGCPILQKDYSVYMNHRHMGVFIGLKNALAHATDLLDIKL